MKAILMISLLCFLTLSCKSPDKAITDVQQDQLEVDLQGKMKAERLMASFPHLGLDYLCTVSKEKNVVIFSVNITDNELLHVKKFLAKEVGVEGVKLTKGCP